MDFPLPSRLLLLLLLPQSNAFQKIIALS